MQTNKPKIFIWRKLPLGSDGESEAIWVTYSGGYGVINREALPTLAHAAGWQGYSRLASKQPHFTLKPQPTMLEAMQEVERHVNANLRS